MNAISSFSLASRRRVLPSNQLHNEDDPPQSSTTLEQNLPSESSQPPPPEIDAPPPPYCSLTGAAAGATGIDFQSDLMPVPPPYSVATSLPTYDEAEKAKAAAVAAGIADATQREEEFPPRDDFNDADQLRVGNDGIFMLAFFMAFLFNWIGFCLSFCLTNTIAGRYGAICGFGLSLIKWILIVRFSDYFTGYFNGQYWLWWIFLVLGLLLFFRGFINYLKVRNMSENMAAAHRTRLLFLY
ncbi:NEDD4 family-interacting protein 2 isoform X1 [Callorhinchus milii]|uniref:NEDD4 family-interacting protein 2-like protein n=1 Tax=Callorhinchus milii TaxID=7868 RepID=V9KMP4_CALMI|nr:NEDD4 family-interacting protein 2 isoform X1 [Callorhinchus milii]XP_007900757.1 NEDD4 family-interacting protein 2 isoform X1 [Callorhinchus milii]|eukprot:gi/632968845/ref/XP_007900756.1/ PREDICTED: NEDD4 family-interacting protein 2 isoform X1 [Callorhinchus milii]